MRSREEFEREFPSFFNIMASARDLGRLICLDKPADSIANFGCGEGLETLALMHAAASVEGVGIDIDGEKVLKGTRTLEALKCAALSVAHGVMCHGEEYHEWWRDLVPDCVKGLVLNQIPEGPAYGVRESSVTFIQADITQPVCIASDHFDLVYCKSVLYQVVCDHGALALQRAVDEMTRVAVPGGCVVAVEPLSCSPERPEPLDFAHFFERAGLHRCQTDRKAIRDEGEVRTYRYGKPPA